MRAMTLTAARQPLELGERAKPVPSAHELVLRVEACGVCRTDLHVVDGELPHTRLPVIPGHQIIGVVEALGDKVSAYRLGDRVGIPWLGKTCGNCRFCVSDRENLCEDAKFTGYQLDGGFAEYASADSRFVLPIPNTLRAVQAAPLLCAGIIGYRSLKMTGVASRLGLFGFGAAAHIVAQVASHQDRSVYAFTRPGDSRGQAFARQCGAVWAGGSDEVSPALLDAAIIFAPVGKLVPAALAAVDKGGIVVCAGIHMSDIPSFPYSLLWQERMLRSVANMTRQDGKEFFDLLRTIPITTRVTRYALEDAEQALSDLRAGSFEGAAVIVPD